jgi:hypothetical protein
MILIQGIQEFKNNQRKYMTKFHKTKLLEQKTRGMSQIRNTIFSIAIKVLV